MLNFELHDSPCIALKAASELERKPPSVPPSTNEEELLCTGSASLRIVSVSAAAAMRLRGTASGIGGPRVMRSQQRAYSVTISSRLSCVTGCSTSGTVIFCCRADFISVSSLAPTLPGVSESRTVLWRSAAAPAASEQYSSQKATWRSNAIRCKPCRRNHLIWSERAARSIPSVSEIGPGAWPQTISSRSTGVAIARGVN